MIRKRRGRGKRHSVSHGAGVAIVRRKRSFGRGGLSRAGEACLIGTMAASDAPLLLALDQGTTSTRAILFGPDLVPRASAQEELPQRYPAPGSPEPCRP